LVFSTRRRVKSNLWVNCYKVDLDMLEVIIKFMATSLACCPPANAYMSPGAGIINLRVSWLNEENVRGESDTARIRGA